MYYIFAFRSRNQSMRFYESLKRNNISSRIVTTPRSVSVGCGLSVLVMPNLIDSSRRVFGFSTYDTFLGLFYINADGSVRRI